MNLYELLTRQVFTGLAPQFFNEITPLYVYLFEGKTEAEECHVLARYRARKRDTYGNTEELVHVCVY